MRKTLLILSAAAALVSAQTASADAPSTTKTKANTNEVSTTCTTKFQRGVPGAYGAWGSYVDGCTAKQDCPAAWRSGCEVHITATIETRDDTGRPVTLNARERYGPALGSFHDYSCAAEEDTCTVELFTGTYTNGLTETLQCNGVRALDEDDSARVSCGVRMVRVR